MAKLKMRKLPRKPKASASVATKENYLKKVAEIKKENQHRHAQNKKSEHLTKVISGITHASVVPSHHSTGMHHPKKRKHTATKTKKARRRKR